MSRFFRLSGLALCACLTGCISTVSVKQIDPASDARGLRFSLPVTMLMVQPQVDGSATYTWVYPPDPNRTYAIQPHNFLSKFNLDVAVSNGLLSKANSLQDTTTIPAKLLDSAQSAFAAHTTAQTADSKTKAAALTAAETALASATLALQQAKDEQEILSTDGDAGQKLNARLKVADAQAAYDQARTAVAKLQSSGDVPAGATGPTSAQQYGPTLFAFSQDANGKYHLKQVNVQVVEDTVIPAAAPTAPPGPGHGTTTVDRPFYDKSAKPLVVTITVTPAAAAIDPTSSNVTETVTLHDVKPKPAFTMAANKITVTFANGLPVGDYVISPAIGPVGGPFANPAPVTIHVQ